MRLQNIKQRCTINAQDIKSQLHTMNRVHLGSWHGKVAFDAAHFSLDMHVRSR
jgi:hypothetical protein